jgi:gliding motility-associated-like protein
MSLSVETFAQKTDGDEVSDKDLHVFIPNAFTPNGDGLNDLFRPTISGPELQLYELRIIDRNGGEVFYSTDPERYWNGSVDGQDYVSSPSLYIYFLKVQSILEFAPQTYNGHVVLIR